MSIHTYSALFFLLINTSLVSLSTPLHSPHRAPPPQSPRQGRGSDHRVSLLQPPLKQFLPCQPCFSSHILLIPITRSWALLLANRSPFQLENEEEEPPLAPWACCPTAKWRTKNRVTAHIDEATLKEVICSLSEEGPYGQEALMREKFHL